MFDTQNRSKQNKKAFVFENEQTCQSHIVYHSINIQSELTDLKDILEFQCPIQRFKIELFNSYQSEYVALQKINPLNPTMVPTQLLLYGFVIIRFKMIRSQANEYSIEDSEQKSSQQSHNKKDRSKQRTIAEVIQLVKRWRSLHTGIEGKKYNLQEAAKIVNVSKKSLDDYYYQLRLGQQNDFDFQSNLDQKIGLLRTYVKSNRPQKTQNHRNTKHPKRLKIIEGEQLNMGQEESNDYKNQMDQNQQVLNNSFIKSQQDQLDPFFTQSASLLIGKDLSQIQKNYYGNFQHILDQDFDPFFFTGNQKIQPFF